MNPSLFLDFFPIIEPPYTITEESSLAFSRENTPIPEDLWPMTFGEWEPDYIQSEEVEYVPCLQTKISDEFSTLVYWRASAMKYEYFLLTLTKDGKLIDRKLIAGLVAKEDNLVRMACSVDQNQIFYVTGGMESKSSNNNTETFSIEVLPDGHFLIS